MVKLFPIQGHNLVFKFLQIVALAAGCLVSSMVRAQDSEPKIFMRGYIKDLVTYNFNDELDRTLVDNLVHNRINLTWYPNDRITGKIGIRNRIFTGDLVQMIPIYSDLIDVDNDYLDLSWTIMDRNSIVIHSIIDRAYLTWNKDDWEVTVGRQRINWGLNLVWNPNDIFNTYSFFDFDYEERQGSDAVRVQYFTGVTSSLEFAAKLADSWDTSTLAFLWKTNKWDYDFQFLVGLANSEIVLGTGWAGRIGNAGFKGEYTWFIADEPNTDNQVLASVSADYSFQNSLYIHVSALYNSLGANRPRMNDFNSFTTEKLNIKSISPYQYSTFLQLSYNIHPLVNAGISSIYYPGGSEDFFIGPSVTVSVVQNLDIDVISQFFVADSTAKLLFTRLKWSF